MIFSQSSQTRLNGVHPKLILVAQKALSYGIIDITVTPDGGVRTPEKEQQLVNGGHSQTLNSKHLIQPDGFGHAIDIAPFPVDLKDISRFYILAALMFRAAMELNTAIEWGGFWTTLKDYGHFQLKGD